MGERRALAGQLVIYSLSITAVCCCEAVLLSRHDSLDSPSTLGIDARHWTENSWRNHLQLPSVGCTSNLPNKYIMYFVVGWTVCQSPLPAMNLHMIASANHFV